MKREEDAGCSGGYGLDKFGFSPWVTFCFKSIMTIDGDHARSMAPYYLFSI